MDIREATDDDIPTVRSLAREAWTAVYADTDLEPVIDDAVTEWYDDDTMARIVDDDEQACLVAADEGEVVGFSHGATDGSDGDVLRLFVRSDRWGEGIGTALLEAMEAELVEMGADRIQAMVLADNGMGNAFYERRGFEKTDEAGTRLGDATRTENVFVKVR